MNKLEQVDDGVSLLWGFMLLETDAGCDDKCLQKFTLVPRASGHDSTFGKGSKQSHFSKAAGKSALDVCQGAMLDCCTKIRGANENEKKRNARAMCLAITKKSERSG